MKKLILVWALGVVVFLGLSLHSFSVNASGLSFERNYLIVRLVDHALETQLQQVSRTLGLRLAPPFSVLTQFRVVEVPASFSSRSLEKTVRTLRADPSIEYVEAMNTYHSFELKPEPFFHKQWSLHNTGESDGNPGADVNILKAWEIEKGRPEVVVAVIDTGVDFTHTDLAANMWINPGEKGQSNDGIDNDGNGFIDDLYGWNFSDGATTGNPKDDHRHGTHCAGVIAAAQNGFGIVGVAPQVRIMALKFLDKNGDGNTEGALRAIDYALANGAQVLSNSWGGDVYSKAMEEAIETANKKGVVFVAAAGNESADIDDSPLYPAAYHNANVITVAATDRRDLMAYFSSYGAIGVHLAAPGAGILSSVPGNIHEVMSGTSMAAPHVSGAVALLKSHFPSMSPLEIKERLMASVDRLPQLEGAVASGGRLNIASALLGNSSVPPVPPLDGWHEVSYPLSSPHPYPSLSHLQWTVGQPGAKAFRLHFKKMVLKPRDSIVIREGKTKIIQTLRGASQDFWSESVAADRATILLVSDGVYEDFGFEIDRYAFQK
ncbi:S8 family serine peptidase [Bdellovibrionota bacterium FG-2]